MAIVIFIFQSVFFNLDVCLRDDLFSRESESESEWDMS